MLHDNAAKDFHILTISLNYINILIDQQNYFQICV